MPIGLFYLNNLDRCISIWFVCTYYYHISKKFMYLMQTVKTLIRRRIIRRLILVYTVSQCPVFIRTLVVDGLRRKLMCSKGNKKSRQFFFLHLIMIHQVHLKYTSEEMWYHTCEAVYESDAVFKALWEIKTISKFKNHWHQIHHNYFQDVTPINSLRIHTGINYH